MMWFWFWVIIVAQTLRSANASRNPSNLYLIVHSHCSWCHTSMYKINGPLEIQFHPQFGSYTRSSFRRCIGFHRFAFLVTRECERNFPLQILFVVLAIKFPRIQSLQDKPVCGPDNQYND